MHTESSPPPTSLARTLARRTTDLLAISIVIIFGLTAGRELIQWWRTEDAVPSGGSARSVQAEWSQRPLRLRIGTSPLTLSRQPFTGTRAAAEEKLLSLARLSLLNVGEVLAPPTPAETDWLAALGKLTPEESSTNFGALFRLQGVLPAVAATKQFPASPADGAPFSRLVSWGMAMPRGERDWTLLMFHPAASESAAGSAGPMLPDGARTLIAWNDEQGQSVVSFHGPGNLTDWRNHFHQQFGPKPPDSMSQTAKSVTAQWETAEGIVELQLSQSLGEEITGLLWITAPVRSHNDKAEHHPSNTKP
jgi:hypothetical protein